MPRVHSSQRQKNKPFKGKSGATKKGKTKASTKTKNIAKPKGRVKKSRANLVQEAKNKRQN